jgi:acetyl esterase/lipase
MMRATTLFPLAALACAGARAGGAPPPASAGAEAPLPPAGPPDDTFERLWPGPAPGAKTEVPEQSVDVPGVTIFLPPRDRANGAAVIVDPGGGYYILAADHEGRQVARWLNRLGVTAFVLRYRLRPRYEAEAAFVDGQRAVRWVRHHAARFGVSPSRIGMMGFSAGGNLASWVGTRFDDGNAAAADPIERAGSRPDFLLLGYPAISHKLKQDRFGASTEDLVGQRTPPTFLVHTHEDELVTPAHSLAFYQALLAHGVPAELHIFGVGPHGTGLAPGDPELGRWPELAAAWLRRGGFFTDARRLAVSGEVLVDGAPMPWGWVTFLPEDARSPAAAAYLGSIGGKFAIDQRHGPCPGRHRVEIHLVSAATEEDKKLGRTTMADARVYRQAAPGDTAPLVFDLREGQAPLRIEIRTR